MKNWIKSVLYVPKHEKPTDENILRLLLPSFAGIILCMVCLVGMTWAWFSAGVQTSPQTIAAGHYDITVTIDGEPVDTSRMLQAETTYTITLTASGTAPSGGYCLIENESKTVRRYTQVFKPNAIIEIQFTPPANGIYTFTGIWGSIPEGVKEDDMIREAGTPPLPNAPEAQQPAADESVYTVQSGDSLWEIAEQYEGLSADQIAAYNGIDNVDKLHTGQEIKIPPADYEMPEPPAASSTEPPAASSAESPATSSIEPPAASSAEPAEAEPAPDESTDELTGTESETVSHIAPPAEGLTEAAEDSPGGTNSDIHE